MIKCNLHFLQITIINIRFTSFIGKNLLSNDHHSKAGESQGRAPGQASDYALRAPNRLGSGPHGQTWVFACGFLHQRSFLSVRV